ncbi:MAG: hypothetical protein ABW221_26310 [Vicinamibacteria bacterium]
MRGALALALLSSAGTALAQPARAPSITVTYRSETAVYVSAGRAAGLSVGDRLVLGTPPETVAELEVTFLAEHSASCRIVKETRPLKRGDALVRVAGGRVVPPSPPPPETTASPARVERTAPSPASRPAAFARATGGVSLGYSTTQDRSDFGRDASEQLARYDLALRGVSGRPLEARVRGSVRKLERERLYGPTVPGSESRDRLYEASVAWNPPAGAFAAMAGRLGATPFAGLGYLDGVLGEFRPTASSQVGAFAGTTPDADDASFDGGRKLGAYVRLAPRTGPLSYDFVLGGIREDSAGEASREWVTQEGQVRTGSLWLRERIEIDLNRGWREERAGRASQLSEARVLAGWRVSPRTAFTVSYERRRNFWSAFTRGIPGDLFDLRLHETLRADLERTSVGGAGFSMGGSYRRREGDEREVYAAHGSARLPTSIALVGVEATFYQTLFTRGVSGTAQAARNLRGGHRLAAAYSIENYDLLGFTGGRLGQRVRASGYGQLPRRSFVRADVEYSLGDDFEGTRAFVEAGVRF